MELMAIESPLPSVTGTDLNTLRDDIAYVIREIERLFRVEDLRSVDTYTGGWADGNPAVQFYKGPDHRVHLMGFADKAGAAPPEIMFTLPRGYRPVVSVWFWVGVQEIEIDVNGDVSLNVNPTYTSPPGVNLTGISFLAI